MKNWEPYADIVASMKADCGCNLMHTYLGGRPIDDNVTCFRHAWDWVPACQSQSISLHFLKGQIGKKFIHSIKIGQPRIRVPYINQRKVQKTIPKHDTDSLKNPRKWVYWRHYPPCLDSTSVWCQPLAAHIFRAVTDAPGCLVNEI